MDTKDARHQLSQSTNFAYSLHCRDQLAAVYNSLSSLFLKDRNIVSYPEIMAACPGLGAAGGSPSGWSNPDTLAAAGPPLLGLVSKAAVMLVVKVLADLMVSDAQVKMELLADTGKGLLSFEAIRWWG